MLPDEVADGEATVRIGRTVNGAERVSEPFTFLVTSGPLPLKPSAVAFMTAVSPGEFTDLASGDLEVEFELRRADRVELEFRQRDVTEIVQATGAENSRIRVPARLTPGQVSVRTRTWIDQTASEWSEPVTFSVRQP